MLAKEFSTDREIQYWKPTYSSKKWQVPLLALSIGNKPRSIWLDAVETQLDKLLLSYIHWGNTSGRTIISSLQLNVAVITDWRVLFLYIHHFMIIHWVKETRWSPFFPTRSRCKLSFIHCFAMWGVYWVRGWHTRTCKKANEKLVRKIFSHTRVFFRVNFQAVRLSLIQLSILFSLCWRCSSGSFSVS